MNILHSDLPDGDEVQPPWCAVTLFPQQLYMMLRNSLKRRQELTSLLGSLLNLRLLQGSARTCRSLTTETNNRNSLNSLFCLKGSTSGWHAMAYCQVWSSKHRDLHGSATGFSPQKPKPVFIFPYSEQNCWEEQTHAGPHISSKALWYRNH